MANFFSFDINELPATAIAALSVWSIWQAVYNDVAECATASDVVDVLSDYGCLDSACEYWG